MSNRILVAVDGSQASAEAAKVAARIARENWKELILLNVLETGSADSVDKVHIQLEQFFKSAAAFELNGVRYLPIVETGDLKKKVLDVAELMGAEMIVIGFVGLKGVGKFKALGDVARSIIEDSKIPVLVVPQEQKERITPYQLA
ncbi:MAG: universal stress protein [Thaumarchaeota archaeon]|nr:universal stress protein [Nitrososphaerota archaeon]